MRRPTFPHQVGQTRTTKQI